MENDAEAREGADAALPLFERGRCCTAWSSSRMNAAIAAPTMPAGRRRCCTFPNFSQLLVIDDDEMADPHWLETHVRARRDASAPTSSAGRRCRCSPTRARPGWADASGLRAALLPDRAGAGAVFLRQSAGQPQRAGGHGPALPRPAIQFHGRRRFRFPEPLGTEGLQARLVRGGESVRDRSGAARSRPTGSGRAACATASSRRWSKRRSVAGTPLGQPRVFAKSLALLGRLAVARAAAR